MKFTVLLSVYANESEVFLDQALESVWCYQKLKPDQIVVVKDGPVGRRIDCVLEKWYGLLGDVLTVVEVEENVGLGAALNIGLKHCSFELVARMDTDDIAMPDRFLHQIKFMKENPSIAASSAQVEEWDEGLSIKINDRRLPCSHNEIVKFSRLRSPLSHPVAVFRREVVLDLGGYPPLRKAQDYGLWSLLIVHGYELGNLPVVLLKMRTGDKLLERRGAAYFKYEADLLRYQREIGFLDFFSYVRNYLAKGILRLLPPVVKRLLYNIAR